MSKIIKNLEYFQEDFSPNKIVGRREKTREIKQRIMPDSFIHLHVFGESGTGKTSTIKKILKKHPNSLYVNCWNKPSKHFILEEILREIGIGVAPKQATNDLVRRFYNIERKVICLDEIEKLKQKDILVILAQHCHCLILISNDRYCLDKIDYKSEGKLSIEEIEFKKYSDQDVEQILMNCIGGGLYVNSISDTMISTIIELSRGNIRVAIQTLAIAARYAE